MRFALLEIQIQWGLEIRTRNTEHHPYTEHFSVRFSNGSDFEWSVPIQKSTRTDHLKTELFKMATLA